jgi:hypothetical protein
MRRVWISTGVAVFAVTAVLVIPAATPAAFTAPELKCRETISKLARKVAEQSVKSLAACHKKRSGGKLAGATDCNAVAVADTRAKIPVLESKLAAKAADKCSNIFPVALHYAICPSPCDTTVPGISSFANVTECISCLTQGTVEVLSQALLGAPISPLAEVERACHGAVGKAVRKHFKTVVKERIKCQTLNEKQGAESTAVCSRADPSGKIAKKRAKSESKLLARCDVAGIDLFAVDSCNGLLPALMASCVLNTTDGLGDEVFRSFYGLSSSGTTTTTFPPTTTTTTTTTTTIPGQVSCDVTIGVTSVLEGLTELGALQYEVDYGATGGDFVGEGGAVSCTPLAGAIAVFNDRDAEQVLFESIISQNGFAVPTDVVVCEFIVLGDAPAVQDFVIDVLAASSPDFEPATPTVVVTNLICTP